MIRVSFYCPLILCLSSAVISVTAFSEGFAQVNGATHQCVPKFTGRPRDIDFIANAKWVQVVLDKDPQTELVSRTANPHILSIIDTAFSLKANVSVDYRDDPPHTIKRLTCVVLDLKGPIPPKTGSVLSLAYDEADKACYASIQEKTMAVDVKTQDVTAQGILETAVRTKLPVQELMYDAMTKLITRVKVNMP
jgi:hypothetical protein